MLKDDGMIDLLERIPNLPNLTYINVSANRITDSVVPAFLKFVNTFAIDRALTIDFKL
jgi:Leucine-rich repeat (LRR) protein